MTFIPLLHRWYLRGALDPRGDAVFLALLLLAEALLGMIIIEKVPYTEIDWQAYMEQVHTWYDDGELDYRNIRGQTGPLVYPAGFLYVFGLLRAFTEQGAHLRRAQYLFLVFYLATQGLVLLLFQQTLSSYRQRRIVSATSHRRSTTGSVSLSSPPLLPTPSLRSSLGPETTTTNTTDSSSLSSSSSSTLPPDDWQQAQVIWTWRMAMALLTLSKRLHSIYLLRLFNDGLTMMLLYAALVLMIYHQWNWGCIVFSCAVSIKMNVLLFAPGLLLLLLQVGPDLTTVLFRLFGCCALPQLILGAPFLLTHPVSYLRKAFELDRVFFYQWTVNWKFLPEHIFVSKPLSLGLLAGHITGLVVLALQWRRAARQSPGAGGRWVVPGGRRLSPQYIMTTMLASNFVGICLARTLHYQFYCWYFHAVPYLLFAADFYRRPEHDADAQKPYRSMWSYPLVIRLLLMGGIEYAFLAFPSSPMSSAVLQVCHWAVLCQIQPPPLLDDAPEDAIKQD